MPGYGTQFGQFAFEHAAAAVVFVAQVDVDLRDADGPGRDQHAFEKAVRVALEVDAVLEGAGLALVDIHRHQARRGFVAHDAPLAAGRKACAAEAAQARVFHRLDDGLDFVLAGDALLQQAVAAFGFVSRVVDEGFGGMRRGLRIDQGLHRVDARMRQRALADCDGRRLLATADARRGDHAYVLAQNLRQPREKILRARHFARQAIADAHGECRRYGIAFLHDIEVVIEGRDFIDLRLRQIHLARERCKVARTQVAEVVLQAVQVFDQQIVRARRTAEQSAHVFERRWIDDAALRRLALALALRAVGNDRNGSGVHRWGLSNRAVGAQLRHVGGTEAQLRQHFVGMFAEQGRACHLGRAVGHLDRVADA
jgi:hypothetical protein